MYYKQPEETQETVFVTSNLCSSSFLFIAQEIPSVQTVLSASCVRSSLEKVGMSDGMIMRAAATALV